MLPHVKHEARNTVLMVLFFLFVWLFSSALSYTLVVKVRKNRFDFYPRWVGAREVLHRNSPYSREVTLKIQLGMFGRYLQPHEDQQRFAYTPLITWLLLPFWILPFPWAVSLWCGLQLTLLLFAPLWMMALLRWQMALIPFFTLLIFSIIVYRYPMNAYLLGQFIPFVFFCLLIGLWGVVRGKETTTGLALIWAMVRPEVTLLPLLSLLFIAFRKGQKKVLGLWLTGMLILWGFTRLWIGPWEMDFFRGIFAYIGYATPVWPPLLLGNIRWGLFLFLLVLGWALWMVAQINQYRHFPSSSAWMLSVAVIVSLLLLPQTGNYTLTLGLIPIWLMAWVVKGKYLGLLPLLVILSSPWVFYVLRGSDTSLEHLFVPLFLLVALSLYWLLWKRQPLHPISPAGAK